MTATMAVEGHDHTEVNAPHEQGERSARGSSGSSQVPPEQKDTLLPAPKAVYIVALPPSLERTFVQQWSETKTLARVLPPPDPSCWSACVIA